MLKYLYDPDVVNKIPLVAVGLLELANVGQLIRMWTTWTAEGQSLFGWSCVGLALILWLHFYRVCTPDQKWAIRGTLLGIIMNALVIFSVIIFRYLL